ncbi:MAG: hypothetical protein E7161_04480 [Firmicutes bacterium]|nr:hypothetical protein [Bacillota bacterium]
MKKIGELDRTIFLWSSKLEKRIADKQREAAAKICDDVRTLAPGSGRYSSSIKLGETKIENGVITTSIYTDLMSEGHAIGRMIEHGTGIYALEPHIGKTPTFIASGYRYWFVPSTSVDHAIGRKIIIDGKEFYIAYAQKPKPHFVPALNSNKDYYKKKLREAFKK